MKNFWDKISKNTYYKKIFKNPFTYVTGAVLLSLFQIAIFAVTGSPWGVSGVFANWGAWIYELLGGSVDKWHYFSSSGAQATLDNGILNHGGSWLNFGIIAGALFSTLAASQFKLKKIKGVREVIAVSGFSIMSGASENLGFAIVNLDDWSKRTTPDLSISAIRGKIMKMGATIPQGEVRAFQPPAIMGLGVTGGVTFAFRTAGGESPQEFEQQMGKLLVSVCGLETQWRGVYG